VQEDPYGDKDDETAEAVGAAATAPEIHEETALDPSSSAQDNDKVAAQEDNNGPVQEDDKESAQDDEGPVIYGAQE
jgi:hypothetical protein